MTDLPENAHRDRSTSMISAMDVYNPRRTREMSDKYDYHDIEGNNSDSQQSSSASYSKVVENLASLSSPGKMSFDYKMNSQSLMRRLKDQDQVVSLPRNEYQSSTMNTSVSSTLRNHDQHTHSRGIGPGIDHNQYISQDQFYYSGQPNPPDMNDLQQHHIGALFHLPEQSPQFKDAPCSAQGQRSTFFVNESNHGQFDSNERNQYEGNTVNRNSLNGIIYQHPQINIMSGVNQVHLTKHHLPISHGGTRQNSDVYAHADQSLNPAIPPYISNEKYQQQLSNNNTKDVGKYSHQQNQFNQGHEKRWHFEDHEKFPHQVFRSNQIESEVKDNQSQSSPATLGYSVSSQNIVNHGSGTLIGEVSFDDIIQKNPNHYQSDPRRDNQVSTGKNGQCYDQHSPSAPKGNVGPSASTTFPMKGKGLHEKSVRNTFESHYANHSLQSLNVSFPPYPPSQSSSTFSSAATDPHPTENVEQSVPCPPEADLSDSIKERNDYFKEGLKSNETVNEKKNPPLNSINCSQNTSSRKQISKIQNPVKALTIDLLKTYESIEGPSSFTSCISESNGEHKGSTEVNFEPVHDQTYYQQYAFHSSTGMEQMDESYNLGLVSSAMGVPLNKNVVCNKKENNFQIFYPSAINGIPVKHEATDPYFVNSGVYYASAYDSQPSSENSLSSNQFSNINLANNHHTAQIQPAHNVKPNSIERHGTNVPQQKLQFLNKHYEAPAGESRAEVREYNDGYDDSNYDYIIHPGEILEGRYLLKERIGKGSFGQVVRAIDLSRSSSINDGQGRKGDGKPVEVAIKIIKSKKPFKKQALTEIDILTMLKLRDPHDQYPTVKMDACFLHRNHYCLVFEMLSFNLYELLKHTGFRGVNMLLLRKFTYQLLLSLAYLAKPELDIIHCDLKPENILLRQPHRSAIKLIDFGSSCRSKDRLYTYIQSRFYRSPEVILGLPYSKAIDMWSLGCVLVELTTGSPLFGGNDMTDQLRRIVEVLGMPPDQMVEAAKPKEAMKYFEVNQQPSSPQQQPIDMPHFYHYYSLARPFCERRLSKQNHGKWKLKKELAEKNRYNMTLKAILKVNDNFLVHAKRQKHEELTKQAEMHAENQPNKTSKGMSISKQDENFILRHLLLDLVHKMLLYDPNHRITPQMALSHPFLSGISPHAPPPDYPLKLYHYHLSLQTREWDHKSNQSMLNGDSNSHYDLHGNNYIYKSKSATTLANQKASDDRVSDPGFTCNLKPTMENLTSFDQSQTKDKNQAMNIGVANQKIPSSSCDMEKNHHYYSNRLDNGKNKKL